MQNRRRLLMVANALLYFGPLLAGLGGFGWSVVPIFAAIFMLWLVVMRPQEWPRSMAEWQRPEALVALAARAAVQLLIVVVSFGIGRGLGGALGAIAPFPISLPIAISFLSVPFARMVWNPTRDADLQDYLKDALHQHDGHGVRIDPAIDASVQADAMLEPLCALPDYATEGTLVDHLRAIASHTSHQALHEALVSRVTVTSPPRVAQKALIIHATDPVVANELMGYGAPARAFGFAGKDPELLDLFARRCAALIVLDPASWADCPSSAMVRAAGGGFLVKLADALDRAAPVD